MLKVFVDNRYQEKPATSRMPVAGERYMRQVMPPLQEASRRLGNVRPVATGIKP